MLLLQMNQSLFCLIVSLMSFFHVITCFNPKKLLSHECQQICKRCPKQNIVQNVCGDAGTVLEECGCCLVCAKRQDDFCSGDGQCASGLHCDTVHGAGTCQPKSHTLSIIQTPARHLDGHLKQNTCKPDCTYEFCSQNPHETCSAGKNVIKRRGCQGKCQHTNCQACYFKTKKESPCEKCGTDDFECMKKFAACIHVETCSKHKFPCQSQPPRKRDGRFVCKVAACLL